jgi:hypothetical protein
VYKQVEASVADPDQGSGAFFDPYIRIRSRDEQPGSYFRELRNNFLEIKYLNSSMGIRDGKNRIRDKTSY